MAATDVPVNRQLVGILAGVCGLLGVITWSFSDPDGANLWPGAFVRVGTVLGALWLALPTRHREAAWARVPIWKVLGVLLAIILIARTRIPLKLLIPAGLAFALVIVVLRPRGKVRPGRS
jgi:hypothetical protein